MVAYLDAEALAATLATGQVHFHSRSRGRLWRKGETSGNVLALREARLDCDGDALLLRVEPSGPTCHRGTRSCFDPETTAGPGVGPETSAAAPQGFDWLETLWTTIAERACDPTGRLLHGAPPRRRGRCGLSQGHRGSHRGPPGGQGRRRGRGRRAGSKRDAGGAGRRGRRPALSRPRAAGRARPPAGGGHRRPARPPLRLRPGSASSSSRLRGDAQAGSTRATRYVFFPLRRMR